MNFRKSLVLSGLLAIVILLFCGGCGESPTARIQRALDEEYMLRDDCIYTAMNVQQVNAKSYVFKLKVENRAYHDTGYYDSVADFTDDGNVALTSLSPGMRYIRDDNKKRRIKQDRAEAKKPQLKKERLAREEKEAEENRKKQELERQERERLAKEAEENRKKRELELQERGRLAKEAEEAQLQKRLAEAEALAKQTMELRKKHTEEEAKKRRQKAEAQSKIERKKQAAKQLDFLEELQKNSPGTPVNQEKMEELRRIITE